MQLVNSALNTPLWRWSQLPVWLAAQGPPVWLDVYDENSPQGEAAEALPPLQLPEDSNGWPEAYEVRDARLQPRVTLGEWRAALDARLAAGAPYGKLGCTAEQENACTNWRLALQQLPPGARPRDVYAAASPAALSFLGF